MTDRKKPGVAFWATVVMAVVLVGCPLSAGPWCYATGRYGPTFRIIEATHWIFVPLESAMSLAPEWISEPYHDYCFWWEWRGMVSRMQKHLHAKPPQKSIQHVRRHPRHSAEITLFVFPPQRHSGYDRGMAIALTVSGIAYAAFSLWLTVRIINRRERWAKWTAVALLVLTPVLYVLSNGPAAVLYADPDVSPIFKRTANWFYAPIVWVCKRSKPITKARQWYVMLWFP